MSTLDRTKPDYIVLKYFSHLDKKYFYWWSCINLMNYVKSMFYTN